MKKSMTDRLWDKLTQGLDPLRLEIIDESDKHIGHAGHNGAGESHFSITIVTHRFAGIGRIERHRMVYSLLSQGEFANIHAISLKLLAPDEMP